MLGAPLGWPQRSGGQAPEADALSAELQAREATGTVAAARIAARDPAAGYGIAAIRAMMTVFTLAAVLADRADHRVAGVAGHDRDRTQVPGRDHHPVDRRRRDGDVLVETIFASACRSVAAVSTPTGNRPTVR
jgi:hypothetical protein